MGSKVSRKLYWLTLLCYYFFEYCFDSLCVIVESIQDRLSVLFNISRRQTLSLFNSRNSSIGFRVSRSMFSLNNINNLMEFPSLGVYVNEQYHWMEFSIFPINCTIVFRWESSKYQALQQGKRYENLRNPTRTIDRIWPINTFLFFLMLFRNEGLLYLTFVANPSSRNVP